ncbi:MAG: serine recombinase [Mycobacterium sp.]|jgi:hypothetical protein|nr:serine recombinase [Mycobacterium sp.]
MEDAVDLLKDKLLDETEADEISKELNDLYDELDQIGVEGGRRELTGPQAKIATDLINAEIAKLKRREQDQERLRVFDASRWARTRLSRRWSRSRSNPQIASAPWSPS